VVLDIHTALVLRKQAIIARLPCSPARCGRASPAPAGCYACATTPPVACGLPPSLPLHLHLRSWCVDEQDLYL